MMSARFLVRVVVRKRVVLVGGGLMWVGGAVGAGGRPVRSTISSSLLSPSLTVMRLRRRMRGRGREGSLSVVRSPEFVEVMVSGWFAGRVRTCACWARSCVSARGWLW